MSLTARDVMDECFQTLRQDMTIAHAVGLFQRAGRVAGQKIFGMMVTDGAMGLAGMLSIYDIFLLLRPQPGEMKNLDAATFLDAACQRARDVLVGDIMTTEMITVDPDTDLVHIMDIMIRKHVRRLPVVEDGKILGIVYISRVFDKILSKLVG